MGRVLEGEYIIFRFHNSESLKLIYHLSQANPDAKLFRTKPLQFPKEMAILFGGTMATGEAAWTPAFGTILDDMLRMPSENHNLSFASNPMSPQSSNFQEEDQEIELEDQLAELRRKCPYPSRRKKDSRNDALVVSIDNLVSSIDSTSKLTVQLSLNALHL